MNFHKTIGTATQSKARALHQPPEPSCPRWRSPASHCRGNPVFWQQWGQVNSLTHLPWVWLVLCDTKFVKSTHISEPNCWSFSLTAFRVPIVRGSTIPLLTGVPVICSSDCHRRYREHRCTLFLVNMWVYMCEWDSSVTEHKYIWSQFTLLLTVWELITLCSYQHSIFSSVLSFDSSHTK